MTTTVDEIIPGVNIANIYTFEASGHITLRDGSTVTATRFQIYDLEAEIEKDDGYTVERSIRSATAYVRQTRPISEPTPEFVAATRAASIRYNETVYIYGPRRSFITGRYKGGAQ